MMILRSTRLDPFDIMSEQEELKYKLKDFLEVLTEHDLDITFLITDERYMTIQRYIKEYNIDDIEHNLQNGYVALDYNDISEKIEILKVNVTTELILSLQDYIHELEFDSDIDVYEYEELRDRNIRKIEILEDMQ